MVPKPVYELLPYSYVVAAIAVASMLESPIAYVPSILFGLAGLLVFMMRFRYRRYKAGRFRAAQTS